MSQSKTGVLAINRSKELKNTPPTRGTKIINPGAEPIKDILIIPDTYGVIVENTDCTQYINTIT